MLNIQNLQVSYKTNQVLKGLSANWSPNRIHGIVGLNGSGKTTLLNTIFGTVKAQQGTISFNGQPIKKSDIAFLETRNYFYSRITGKEYLGLFKANNPNFNFHEWNDVFGLPLSNLIDTYSTGMKKKLAFLGILSLNRPVLILDEPFNGVDLESNENLKSILRLMVKKQKTILITSHIIDTLTTLCDDIHYLKNGIIESSFKQKDFQTLTEELSKFGSDDVESLVDSL
ncbi:MAG: ATP-binding cassette domain-containing protein [Bacteroidota bacterium]